MIFTESTIKISNNVSKMDSTIVLYRGDKNIEIRFTILQSPFKYSNTVATNVIESTNASYGQLVIKTPNDKPPIFSEVSATKEGTVLFTITKEMIDEIEELGNYTFQIRLLDENKQSRVTIPPVENGIEIKEPIAIEDDNTTNVVGLAKANYAVATLSDVDTPTFDDNGKYNKTNWNDGDIITNTLLNKIEDGIYTTNENVTTTKKYVDDGINYDKKQFNNKIEAMNMSKHPVSCSTEIYKKPLCDIFPELLNITYNTVFRDYNSFKVNMDNFAKEYPTVKSAYNKLNINLYDENDNSIGNSYGNSINGEGLNIIFINITESLRFYAYFDKALVDGSSTTMETKNGYMTIQLLIPKGNNKQEFIDKIKNLKLTLSVFRTDFLNLNNETMYTPTTDYNPATKKYVDDNKIGYIKSETVGETIDTSTMVSSFNNNSYIYESNNVTYLEVGKEYHVIVNGIRYRALCINNMPGNDQIYESIAVNGDGFSIAVMNKIGYNTKYYQDNTKCAYEINLSDELLAAPPTIQILKMDIEYIPTYLMPKDLGILNSISVNRIGDIGTSSAAIGYKNTASNDFTFAMGMNTTANAVAAHAEGGFTVANASYSHAEGFKSISTGQYSHVEGIVCESSGQGSHAEGYYTVASGERSHSEGCFTEAASQYQHVQGKYNVVDSTGAYAHIVGNGANKNARSNAHTLDWKGNGWYAGKLSQEGTPTEDKDLATKKYVDDNMTTAINEVKGDLGTEELTTTSKDLKGAVNELNTQYKEKANVLQHIEKNLDLYPYTEQNGYLYVTVEKNTMIYMDETNFHSITTNKISCNPGDVFLYKGTGRGNAASWVFFKNDLIVNTGQHQGTIEVTIPQDVNYVIFSSFADIRKDVIFSVRYLNDKTFNSKLNTKFTNIVSTINNIKVCEYPNLFDKTKVVKGYIIPSGEFTTSDSYYTSDYIFFEKGKTYTLSPNVRIIAYYDAYKYFIKTDENAKLSPYTFTVEDDCYLRFCVYANKLDTFMVEEGETNTSYKPYAPILKNDVGFNTSHKEYINSLVNSSNGNVLFGKKLVACGDSFTEGDFTGYTDENGLSGKNSPIIYDKVRGMYKTYPWWIAERNNMILVNEAKCGTTMTYIPEYTNAFSETRYKNLPKDADYILIKFGINDETGHKNAPLGTIDDTTNATFYGAWNVILEYLITNHPWAKIGIIVTNGTSENYANAIRESAKKWGIPYLDEANGENVPLLNRTNKSYVCKKAKDLRDAQMKVGETNGHPNVKAHEYESTIVENFLRSL